MRDLTPDLLAAALDRIDAANGEDPNRVRWQQGEVPLAQLQGRLADAWVQRLRPDADAALRLAARAHHLRRWAVPRDTYPAGRAGYLRWRRERKAAHARELTELLEPLGVEPALVARAARLVARTDLATDPEARTIEDAACLVFLELQLDEVAARLADEDHTVDVLARTARKMSPDGIAAATGLALSPTGRRLLERALAAR